MPILRRATGAAPRPLFDTQIAAAYAGLGSSLSHAALLRELFAIELPKHETRTDWLRRPLSPEQLRYAAEDVEHLCAAAAELERRLSDLGRLDWALEDSAAVAELHSEAADPGEAWRRVRGIDRLPPPDRAVARALAAWREVEADRLDLARPFLLRDETLVALARREGLTANEAEKLPGFDARRHRQHATSWVRALSAARAAAEAGTAPADRERRSPEESARRRELETAISALVARRAGELGLPGELLLSRRQLDRALDAWNGRDSLAAVLGGFRGRLLGPELDALVQGSGGARAPRGARRR